MKTNELAFTVESSEAGLRLDVVLGRRYPQFSRSQLAVLAKAGLVNVDGRHLKPSAALTIGQKVSLPAPSPPVTTLTPDSSVALDVIYEDEFILAVNKPWGLAVHPGAGSPSATLAAGLLAHNPQLNEVGEHLRPGLAHRLDKDTSGLVVTAKTEEILYSLGQAFSRREVKKFYLAFTKGKLPSRRGVIESSIGRHPTQRHKMAAGPPKGRPAKTIYRVLQYYPQTGLSLVQLNIVTGRTHQIRVHLASLGAPVLGDTVYSRGSGGLLEKFPNLAPHIKRQLLHARRLDMTHPANNLPITLRAPWPCDFIALLKEILLIERGAKR